EQFLTEEANSAFERSFNIIRTRVDKFGVTQPNVQRAGDDRLAVDLPGIDDPERVRKLLQGSAKLKFWKTYENAEEINSLVAANPALAGILELNTEQTDSASSQSEEVAEAAEPETAEPESPATSDTTDDDALSLLDRIGSDSAASDTSEDAFSAEFESQNPLFAVLSPAILSGQGGQQLPASGPTIGYATDGDTAKVIEYLAMPEIRANFPYDLVFAWGVNPVDDRGTFQLY